MSKQKHLNRPAGGRKGSIFGFGDSLNSKPPKFETFIGVVQGQAARREGENFTGVDSIVIVKDTGLQQDSTQQLTAKPLNPYFRSIPLSGEKVLVFQTGDASYYSDIINLSGKLGENVSQKDAAINEDASEFFFGLFAKPRETKKMDPTEGDVILEGRAGQTIRFSSTSEESFFGKLFGGKSENKPVIMITCNDDEKEGLGNEDIMEDDCSIYLTSETPIATLQLETKIHKGYEKVNEYADGQIIMRSNRLVLSSKKDNIILAAADKIGISTKKWVVDFDELMDVIQNIQKELDQLTKGAANFTTGVGPTGPTTNASLVAKIGSAIKKLKS